jgi:hypothetical protein
MAGENCGPFIDDGLKYCGKWGIEYTIKGFYSELYSIN